MNSFFENKHSILISSDFSRALPEIILWGEAKWWPRESLMRFVRYDLGPIKIGTRYIQKVLLPFAPKWDVEVSRLTGKSITRKFLNGMFSGEETISIEDAGNNLAVKYVMNYSLNGLLNKIFWPFLFKKMHDANIEAILKNLKEYLEKKA